jgi:hypothetical protein
MMMPDEHELVDGAFYRVRLFGSDDEPGDWTVGRWDGSGYGGGWTILGNPLGLSVVKIGERIVMPDAQRYEGLVIATPVNPDEAPQSRTMVGYDPSVKSAGVFNSDDVSFASVPAGSTVRAVVAYVDTGVDDEPDDDDGNEPCEESGSFTAGWDLYETAKRLLLNGQVSPPVPAPDFVTTAGRSSGFLSVSCEPGTRYTFEVYGNGMRYQANVHGGGACWISFGNGGPSMVTTDEGEFPLVAVEPDAPAAPEPVETPPWLKYRGEPR